MSLHDEDVLVEIFKRLPAKSLVRFRCVSKSWYSLISSPDFISIHAHFTDTSATKPYVLMIIRSRGNFSLRFNDRSFQEYRELSFFPEKGYNAWLNGFCHGLVCLSRSDDGLRNRQIVIWNPTLAKSVLLPEPRFKEQCGSSYLIGFGFDSKRNDYKVIRIRFSCHNPSKLDVPREYELFELSQNAWRIVSPSVTLPFIIAYSPPVFFKGFVHWFGGLVERTIVAFGFADDAFQEMNLPGELKNVDFMGLTILVKERRDLSVVYSDQCPGITSTLSIWVMKEYGVEKSWSKLFKIHYPDFRDLIIRPVGFGTNGELVGLTNDGQLVTYDGCTRSVICLGYKGCHYPINFAVDHIETLVLLQVRG